MNPLTSIVVDWFSPPGGPGTPWGSPWIALLDSVRVLMVVGGLYVLWQCFAAVVHVRNRQQRAIYVAFGLTMLGIAGTEIDHLGDGAHYRFALFAIVIGVGCYGLFGITSRVGDWDGPQPRRHRR